MTDVPLRQPPVGFAGKRGHGWAMLARWMIPGIMTIAYVVLMLTSETDTSGKAWEALGLLFVFVLWFLFRTLTERAALARAAFVGDTARMLELADEQLARWRSERSRGRYRVIRALALECRGQYAEALAELDRAAPGAGPDGLLAASVRIGALVETGKLADARAALARIAKPLPRDAPHAEVRFAEARLRAAEGDRAGAAELVAKIVDDVRAGSGVRDRARALGEKLS